MAFPFWLKRLYYAFIRYKYRVLSQLPHPDVKKGDRFEAMADFKTHGMTHWKAPFTGGFQCVVPKGTILVADYDSPKLSTGFGVTPENYAELEIRLVPEEDRSAQKYNGYSLSLRYGLIGKKLRKL